MLGVRDCPTQTRAAGPRAPGGNCTMPRAGPPYSPEFRAEAVRRLSSGGTTVAELSRELGVSESTLHRWRLQAGDHRGEAAGLAIDEPPRPEEPERKDHPLREEGDGTRRAERPPAHPTPSTIKERAVRRGRLALSHPERTDPCGYLRGSPQMSSTSVSSSSPRPPGGRRAACAGTRAGRTSRPRGPSEGRTQRGMVGAGDRARAREVVGVDGGGARWSPATGSSV
jgi:transposase